VELLVSVSVVTIVIAGLGAMAVTISDASQHNLNQQLLLQHARVAMQRIETSINTATTSEQFPGAVVFSTTAGAWEFPDTLVVWSPETAAPANPLGLPLFSEIKVYCPDIHQPGTLLEIRAPGDDRVVPAIDDLAAWQSEFSYLKSTPPQSVALTSHLRTAQVPETGERGVIRFVQQMRPDAIEWSQYRSAAATWESLNWPLDNAGSSYGVRQVWCRIEMQLTAEPGGDDPAGQRSTPFFGSATVNYGLSP